MTDTLKRGIKMLNRRNINHNLEYFKQMLSEIKKHTMSGFNEPQIKALSQALKERAESGEQIQELLPEAFAIVFEAVKRTLSITPFDVQLLAASAMATGRIIELPTGEGKTLVAVFVAYLGALSGKGVHVLTFNDYLAKRDALWMKPVYEFLGLSVSYINEGMNNSERKEAYNADVTYLTAKEAGFDYLRSFLAYDTDSIVQRHFHLAIIDEADSLLIDEARVPLVIAVDMPARVEIEKKIYTAISKLQRDTHFVMDEYANNISLTEPGVAFIEGCLGLDNLYDVRNLDLLAKVNVVLQAEFLLKKDINYIVRNDKVLLVDEFTGRVVKNRQWPDGLQAAVEIKEGLIPKTQGIVMNRITLQNFLQFYPNLCGMTGTASSSASEFYEFYNKIVTVIPPNKPCIRIDHPDVIFTHKEAKYHAVIKEIKTVQATGRPILVGTSTVEESEHLVELLRPYVQEFFVLNAKNDAEEAEIIANAGKLYAVTISTNMAGRGVDIRLGGKNAEEYERICNLGGLYVIGTNRYESVRIDNQLRGRAGRQGDPGESKFFISLEDNLMVKYRIRDCIPKKYMDIKQNEPLQNSVINKAVVHTQKVVEGQTLDAKITLSKYASVAEDQRKIVYKKREQILYGKDTLSALEKTNPVRVGELLTQVAESEFQRAQKMIELFVINQCWADHLLAIESALDEVQMISQFKGDPLLNYNRKLIDSFENLERRIYDMILQIFDQIVITDGHIDLNKMGVRGPSSTRTYMVNDGTEQLGLIDGLAASAVSAPLYLLYLLYAFFDKRIKRRK
jgi:preprotein translocase subunit SecA